MTELERRVTEIVSLVLDVPADQIPANETADHVPQWDSLAHLSIVASLEQELGLQISPEEARRLRSISQICAFVSRVGGGANGPGSVRS